MLEICSLRVLVLHDTLLVTVLMYGSETIKGGGGELELGLCR